VKKKLLFSIHIPKTAGTSFSAGLRQYYKDRVLHVDISRIASLLHITFFKSTQLIKAVNTLLVVFKPLLIRLPMAIHGHPLTHIAKNYSNKAYLTAFYREPIPRALSDYFFTKKCYQIHLTTLKNPKSSRHQKRFAQYELSLIQKKWTEEDLQSPYHYLRHPRMMNFYQEIEQECPVNILDFVGIIEHYGESLENLNSMFNIHIPNLTKNQTGPTPKEALTKHQQEEMKYLYQSEYVIYNKAVAKFKLQTKKLAQNL
jgi:hypothetical protein